MSRASERNALEFIWDGLEGLAELAKDPRMGRTHVPPKVATKIFRKYRYFAPLREPTIFSTPLAGIFSEVGAAFRRHAALEFGVGRFR